MRKDTGTTCGIPCISYSFIYGKEKNMKWSEEKWIYRGRLEMAREGIPHVVPVSFRILTTTHTFGELSRNILCRSYAHLTPAIHTRGPCQALCAPAPPGLAPPSLARVVLNNRCSSAHVCLHCYTEHLLGGIYHTEHLSDEAPLGVFF